jgi:hypothetical protein
MSANYSIKSSTLSLKFQRAFTSDDKIKKRGHKKNDYNIPEPINLEEKYV